MEISFSTSLFTPKFHVMEGKCFEWDWYVEPQLKDIKLFQDMFEYHKSYMAYHGPEIPKTK